jgi:hypothetical protein
MSWQVLPSGISLSAPGTGYVMPSATRLDQIGASNPATAAVDFASQRLTSVHDPTAAQDAATKNYVDTHAVAGTTFARAYRLAAFTPAAGTWVKVPIDTISRDDATNFSVANSRYTCQSTGDYLAVGQVTATGTGTPTCALYVNGAFYVQGIGGGGQISGVFDIFRCNAADYIELWTWISPAVAYNVYSGANYLSVVRVA